MGQAAADVLAFCVTVAAAEGVTLPERQYVSAGRPEFVAWDCEQLTVALTVLDPSYAFTQGSEEYLPVTSALALPGMPTAVLGVSIVRCAPTGEGANLPDVAAENEAGIRALDDAAFLRTVAVRLATTGPPALPRVVAVRAGAVTPFGVEGGYSAMTLTLAVTIG